MLKIEVNGKEGVFNINLPTSIEEISSSYIEDVTKHIVIEDNYSLIGIVYKEKLSSIVLAASKNNKKSNISVIPIFVRSGNTSSEVIKNLEVRDNLIIAPSEIMTGYHVSASRNLLTINNFLDVINTDNSALKQSLTITDEVYFIEFKLVPNCNIHGAYKKLKEGYSNPFIKKVKDAPKSNIILPDSPKVIL